MRFYEKKLYSGDDQQNSKQKVLQCSFILHWHKEFSKVIPKTREPHIQSGKKMSLKYGLQELEIENNSVSIVSEQFFIIKLNVKINIGYSLPTPSGNDNSVLTKPLFHQIE